MSSDDRPVAAVVLSAAAEVQLAFDELAVWAREQRGMSGVRPTCDLHRGNLNRALEVDWYLSVRHTRSTFDLEYCLEATHEDGEWLIRSAGCAAGHDPNGSERIYELPDRYAVTDREFVDELVGACRTLTDHRAKILDLFLTVYVQGFTKPGRPTRRA
ncbi:hypothetical protein [Actinoplanes palleronii]|uniref:Uncharacterized protein n=1 Tax=Actinoplanes palleronii TaxID=113570 RepID=A0ABQ4BDN6_9ACTN|nr:hypothetical protein [Actinoplanes palleronii]GIE68798.1 hypothetical protein Apa02nite_049060 [Actinoplanes palleronii]